MPGPANDPPWNSGDTVQTPFGKGVVREVRANGRVLVQVRERTLLLAWQAVSAVRPPLRHEASGTRHVPQAADRNLLPRDARAQAVVDLHGMTVEEALARVELALSDAMLANLTDLRFIHGRSGGRIRAALHRRLREIQSVRRFRLDPANAGVTVVDL
jgi:DNA mismatch repair protein MutS2